MKKTYKHNNKQVNKTRQTKKITTSVKNIQGHIISDNNEGWKTIYIYGDAFQRGFAHGFLLKKELIRVKKVFEFLVKHELKMSFKEYISTSNKIIKPIVKEKYPEIYREIYGISKGAKKAGLSISVDYLIGWNAYMSLYSHFKDGAVIKCSAFIATGNATENGDIIMAHNTHTNFADGQLHNVIIHVWPSKGHKFVMQTTPGYIASGTDWFLCGSGIIGCETTIAFINYKPVFGDPYFCRIRNAMQYGNTLDDYAEIMSTNNAGDYACSWQFGDINTNEIMLFEMTLKEKNIQRTKNGVFFGMNTAMGENIRKKETKDIDHTNITSSVGARHARLKELLKKKHHGKLNLDIAKEIMADHYDVYLERDQMGVRGVCKHMECTEEHTNRPPHALFGCTDAKVVNTQMARELQFLGRFGSGCGRTFSIKDHIKKYPYYKNWATVVEDYPSYDWTKITGV